MLVLLLLQVLQWLAVMPLLDGSEVRPIDKCAILRHKLYIASVKSIKLSRFIARHFNMFLFEMVRLFGCEGIAFSDDFGEKIRRSNSAPKKLLVKPCAKSAHTERKKE